MRRVIFSALLLSFVFRCFAVAQSADSSRQSAFATLFASISDQAPGCVAGAIQNGNLTYSHAFGLASIELNAPLTIDSVFNLESLSKQFTGMSIALLVNQQKIGLKDEIQRYIPELPKYDHPITLAEMLHHTSGLKDVDQLFKLAGLHPMDIATPRMALDLVVRQRDLNFIPGTTFSYSNTNYFLLGLVVERVSGMSLARFAKEQIFEPLGMTHTRIRDDATMVIPMVASGYRKRSDQWHSGAEGDETVGPSLVFSTLGDLAKWDENFYQKRVGGDGASQLMLEQTPLRDGSPNPYSAGLIRRLYRGLTVVEHKGDGTGSQTVMMRFPAQHYSVIVLCNSRDQVSPSAIAQKMAEIDLAAEMERPLRDQPVTPLDEATYRHLAGVYWDGSTDLLREIIIKNGKLMQRLLPDDEPRELRLMAPGRFGGSNGVVYQFDLSRSAFVRFAPGDTTYSYHRLAESDLRTQTVNSFVGSFYSTDVNVLWRFSNEGGHLVLHRNGYPDEQLDFAFRDSFFGDLGLLRFMRDSSGVVKTLLVVNYRLGKVRFARQMH
jgi:CubicO group peptidase (beta-lactamase class C family)